MKILSKRCDANNNLQTKMKSSNAQPLLNLKNSILIGLSLTLGVISLFDPRFSIAGISLIIFALFLIAKKPQVILLILICLYPLLPFHFGFDLGRTLPVLKPQRIIILLAIITWIYNRGLKNVISVTRQYPLNKFVVPLIIVMFFSSARSDAAVRSFFYLGSFLIESYLLSIVIYDLFRNKSQINSLFTCIVISAVISSLIGLTEYLIGFNFFSKIPGYRPELEYATTQQIRLDENRIKSAFDHSISFGVYLTFSLAPVMYYLVTCKRTWKKLLCFIIIVLSSIVIYLTLSRCALGALLLLLSTFFLFRGRKELIFMGIFLAIFIVQPFYFTEFKKSTGYFLEKVISPLSAGEREIEGSTVARFIQIEESKKFIEKKPFFGFGMTNLGFESIDNFYVLFILHFGLLGITGYLSMFLYATFKSLILYFNTSDTETKTMIIPLLASLISLMLVWAVVSLESSFYLIWIYVGILMRLCREQNYSSMEFHKSV